MGKYVFRLPDIGEGIAEAEIVAWHVKVGDRIDEDSPLADMMTDKATVEMESPVTGVVREVAGEVGDTVAIGSPLVVIETEGGEEYVEQIASETPSVANEERAVAAEPAPKPTPKPTSARPSTGSARTVGSRALASPAVRARAHALNIDLAAVRAGPDGVVRHEDLDAYLVSRAAPAPAPKEVPPAEKPEAKRPAELLEGAGEQIKVIGLRRRIAENMAASKRHIPHFTYVEECDVTDLERWRGEFNDQRGERPKLTLLPFLITAICRTLPEFPMINARYDDEANVVTRYTSVHLGMATQTPAGLMVLVIRDAQNLTLWALAGEIARLAEVAREGTAKSEELSGSTLTITSLGPLGGIATTPVINRPEVAIIGPNKIVERPVYVEGDRLEKRKLMNISISCDHRVVDGWDAASFIQALKRRIEAPLLMLAGNEAMAQDARIDAYIAKAAPFAQPILTHLRGLIHAAVPAIEETIKWGMPHFTLKGKNLAGLAAFKAHAALVLHGEGRVGGGMGSYGKIVSMADLPSDAELTAALQASAEQLASGVKKPRPATAAKPEIPMPDDFGAALPAEARAFFDGLAPSGRYEYLEWITGAKREETRAKRIAQAAEWLGEGKRLNWKYER